MSKRLLVALDYPNAENLDLSDVKIFKELILWLEVNKIKGASDRLLKDLQNVSSPNWDDCFNKYKEILGCPDLKSHLEELHWFLGKAVQLETARNKHSFIKHAIDSIKISNIPKVVPENPLDELDFGSQEFADRINQVAKSLKICPHPEPLITLAAVRKVICSRMSPACVEKPNSIIIEGTPFPFEDTDLGFDLNDPVLNKAAKILRMLYIHDLRDLQTKANELIVAVQNVTANPKTDTSLGKVGR